MNELIDKLRKRNAILVRYDYSTIDNVQGGTGIIKDLSFDYKTEYCLDTINLGDIPFEYYYDCGDLCIDIMNELFKELEDLATSFEWHSFYKEIMEDCAE